MTKQCSITGSKSNNGYQISHSHIRTHKLQNVNLQTKKVWNSKTNSWQKIKVSTKALKKLLNNR
uniref:Large ribosomal subunit protein bL28c n=1 Tax=Porphyridium sordidum TaxID=28024 RepID=A0A1C9CE21_PORSO|nr:ribosomal protein L28 [Porphyridium sordidum]AOM66607.1 ribosomal protein L28 [Porphyridium sordidum]